MAAFSRNLIVLAAFAAICPEITAAEAPSIAAEDGSRAAVNTAPRVEVSGTRSRKATAGSRMELAVQEIPQAISVIDESTLRDIAPRVLDEVADYVAGVDREAVQGNPYGISFYIRGFNTAGNATTINGFRDYGFNTPQNAVNIERIEFLKGPASVLYGGGGALSGLVNIVTKQPLTTAQHRIEAAAGSFGYRNLTLDSTGPVDQAARVRYRLTAAVEQDGNFVDNTSQRSRFLSPVFSFDVGTATTLDVELIAQDVDRPGREPYFMRFPDFLRIPVTTQLGDPAHPDGDGGSLTRYSGRAELRHRFASGLQLRQAVYANKVHSDDSTIQPTSYNASTGVLSRRVRAVDEYQRERYSQTELSGEGRTGPIRHKWLVGLELGRQETGYAFTVAPFSPVNIFNPQPGERQGPLTVPFPASDSKAKTEALYVQDLMTLGGGFKAMVGARWDRLESTSGDRGTSPKPQTDTELSPRLGLIYETSPRDAFYLSWNRSFRPNLGLDAGGAAFKPQHGRQMELGWKGEPVDRLQTTVAVFEYQRENVLTTDPSNPERRITVGRQRSRGLELEAAGQLLPGWRVIASYGYLDASITRDNVLPVGDQLTGAPRHTVGLFNRVDLGVRGLSATLGLSHASARPSGIPNDPAGPLTAADVELPAYTKVDAGLVYEYGAFEGRLIGRNLTNERIYDGYISTFQPRAPRSWELRLAWRH
ncbi:TonB-dependent siderophore receptor [Paucibacter sp. M5-1]|uniref:TonB-dependent siderophore receptor n=1 Tax=Paucibacter sp. M5-1 TaxID=3015998 RepID=UPI0022B88E55|nr:TonB-dependent siderophore receptor [Paucibacter sp. M5-1]MCZ7883978.1 TonB-dependent siderophore receptor [Paucibacter sp. M5-1]